ncbi:hypothetical protein K488DRAFT_92543, partial [Vararia minispora EC-137]
MAGSKAKGKTSALPPPAHAPPTSAGSKKKKKKRVSAPPASAPAPSPDQLPPISYPPSPSPLPSPPHVMTAATAAAQEELLATAHELQRRLDADPAARVGADEMYWASLPENIDSFVRAVSPLYGACDDDGDGALGARGLKAQAMYTIAQRMAPGGVGGGVGAGAGGGKDEWLPALPLDPSVWSEPGFKLAMERMKAEGIVGMGMHGQDVGARGAAGQHAHGSTVDHYSKEEGDGECDDEDGDVLVEEAEFLLSYGPQGGGMVVEADVRTVTGPLAEEKGTKFVADKAFEAKKPKSSTTSSTVRPTPLSLPPSTFPPPL